MSFACVMLLLCLCQSPAAADAQAPSETPEKTGPKTTETPVRHDSITVNALAVSSAAASITGIDRDEIDVRATSSVAELLRSTPGVSLLSNGARGGLSAVQTRGGDPNFTLVVLDGQPLNDATDQIGGAYNLEGLYAGHLEKIELVRGPLSSFFGSQALGGVLYLTSRRGSGDTQVFEAQLEGGDASHVLGSASYSGGSEKGDFFLGAAFEREQGRVAEEGFEAFHLSGNWARTLGKTATLRLVGRLALWEGEDYPDASGGPRFGSGRLRRSDNDESSFAAHLGFGGGDGSRQNLVFSVYRHNLDRDSPGVGFLVPPAVEQTRLTRIRAAWTASFRLTDFMRLQTGADLERESADNDSLLLLPPAFGGALRGDYSVDRDTAGGFAALVGEKGRLLYEMGIRTDASRDFGAEASPRFAASYSLAGDRARVRGSVGRAFKAPSFFAVSSPRALGGNPDLRPETVWGGDAGLELRFPEARLTVSPTFFYNLYNDLVDFDFDLFLHVNRSRVRTRGLELAVAWEPSPQLAVRSSATWQSVRDLQTGDALLHRPEAMAAAAVFWTPRPRLDLFLETHFVSSGLDRQIPVPNRTRVAGYTLLNLAAVWRVSEHWRLKGRIDNLADHDYEAMIGFPGSGRSARISLGFATR